MPEFGGRLDSWLEAPYVDASRRQDEFERWCEANDVDAEEETAWARFEEDEAAAIDDVPEPPDDFDRDPRDYPYM